MTIGDQLRLLADECDKAKDLSGLLFAMSGTLTLRISSYPFCKDDRQTLKTMLKAATETVEYGDIGKTNES